MQLYDYMQSHGYTPPQVNRYNSYIRFAAPDKPKGNRSAWLMVGSNGEYAVFGDWVTGGKHLWFDDDQDFSPVDRLGIQERIEQELIKQKELQERRYKQISHQVKEILANAKRLETPHGYLIKKRVKQYGLYQINQLQGIKSALLVPICGLNEKGEQITNQYR